MNRPKVDDIDSSMGNDSAMKAELHSRGPGF